MTGACVARSQSRSPGPSALHSWQPGRPRRMLGVMQRVAVAALVACCSCACAGDLFHVASGGVIVDQFGRQRIFHGLVRVASRRRRCLTGAECGREGPAVHPATRCVRFESVPSSARHRSATAMGVRPFHSPSPGDSTTAVGTGSTSCASASSGQLSSPHPVCTTRRSWARSAVRNADPRVVLTNGHQPTCTDLVDELGRAGIYTVIDSHQVQPTCRGTNNIIL